MKHSDFVQLFGNQIGYTSVLYYLFLPAAAVLYYLFPKRHRWIVLLAASGLFYYWLFPTWQQAAVFAASIVSSWIFGRVIGLHRNKRILAAGIIISALPLFLVDGGKMLISFSGGGCGEIRLPGFLVPVGLSFYSLQVISYLADIYSGKVTPQNNVLKYALFISFFPQLIQGPIPRYNDLSYQLTDGNEFDPDNVQRGFQLILWGFFLKLMVADKASVIVDTVFNNWQNYYGSYYLVAGILYSLQLYADFLACTTLSQGAAKIFGITVTDNFNHPYFSTSIKDFWRRWHMSLSFWLRDYVYIPLGGNREGKLRKYMNLMITFLVSGIWHGGTIKFVFWGLLHGFYQIAGELTQRMRNRMWIYLGQNTDSKVRHVCRVSGTCFLVMLAWIIFRAEHLYIGIHMIKSIFTEFSPWILSGTHLFELGLSQLECFVLAISVLLLLFVSRRQEKGTIIGDRIMKLNVLFRYIIYLAGIVTIAVFGTYGFEFNAADFIYGGF